MVIGSTTQTCSIHGEQVVHVIIEANHFNCSAHLKLCKKCLERSLNENQTNADDW